MGKIVKKIHKIHDPLDLDNKLLDPMGLPSLAGKEHGLMPETETVTGSTVTAPANTPTATDPIALEARESQRRRQQQAGGLAGTNLTGPTGLTTKANTAPKSLLGS